MKLVSKMAITAALLVGTSDAATTRNSARESEADVPSATESEPVVTQLSAPSSAPAHAPAPASEATVTPVAAHVPTESAPINHKALLKQIYADEYAGYRIPRDEEKSINKTGGHTTYGEITYDSTHHLLGELNLTSNDVFIDLGSGVGKMVHQVYLESPAKECIGVEFSKSRYAQANKAREQLVQAGFAKPDQKIEFWNKDMLKADIGRATVVFLNGVAHQEQFNRRVIDKLSEADHPIRVVSVVPLSEHPRLKEIRRISLPMSWDEKGVETVIYQTIPMKGK